MDWVKRRYQLEAYTQLLSELQLEDFQQFINLQAVEVQSLVNMMGPVIGKQDTCKCSGRKDNSNTALSGNRQVTNLMLIC
jgi:hypothetical protein